MEKTRREFLQLFGLPPDTEEVSVASMAGPTRREFMQLVAMMTAAAVVLPKIVLPEPEPVRRYWAMGQDFTRRDMQSGLRPIEDQPGLFRDERTGQVVNIRDFVESDKYETIVIPKEAGCDYDGGRPLLHFVQDEYQVAKGPLMKKRLNELPTSDLTFNVPRDVALAYDKKPASPLMRKNINELFDHPAVSLPDGTKLIF